MTSRHGTAFLAFLLTATIFSPFEPPQGDTAWAQTRKPPADPLCALESTRYRVDFVKGGHCCPNTFEFWVEDNETGKQGPMRLEVEAKKAGMMTLVAERKLLVTGFIDRGAKALIVADLEAGAKQDEIHAFDYSLSPSQERLVYSRHIPKDTPDDKRYPLLLYYDLTRSAADNRAGRPADLTADNAGLPVYPEANARQASYEAELEPPHRYLSNLLWSKDETRLVFFELFEKSYQLVELDFSAGAEPVKIRRRPLELVDLASGSATPGGRTPVVTLTWKAPRTVEAVALIDGILREPVTFSFSE